MWLLLLEFSWRANPRRTRQVWCLYVCTCCLFDQQTGGCPFRYWGHMHFFGRFIVPVVSLWQQYKTPLLSFFPYHNKIFNSLLIKFMWCVLFVCVLLLLNVKRLFLLSICHLMYIKILLILLYHIIFDRKTSIIWKVVQRPTEIRVL